MFASSVKVYFLHGSKTVQDSLEKYWPKKRELAGSPEFCPLSLESGSHDPIAGHTNTHRLGSGERSFCFGRSKLVVAEIKFLFERMVVATLHRKKAKEERGQKHPNDGGSNEICHKITSLRGLLKSLSAGRQKTLG